jgi:hypothetical protein
MKEIFKLDEWIESVIINDKEVSSDFTLVLKSGEKIAFSTYHSQDCCESVYADFTVLEYAKKELEGKKFGSFAITGVDSMGFLLHFGDKKFFIPCYNHQNGYYSSDLHLIVKKGNTETKIDISNLTESGE